MKKLILTSLIIAISVAFCYGNDKEVPSEIRNVTVYRHGAQVSRTGEIILPKGNTVLLFKGLPAGISPESIQAKATDDVMIVSVAHTLDYLSRSIVSKDMTALNERRRTLLDSLQMLKNYKSVYSYEKEMILTNYSIGGDNGVNIKDLEQAASFFRKRLTEIEVSTHKLDNIILALKNELVNTSKQLLELNAKIDLPTSLVRVTVSTDKEVKTIMELDYFIEDAGWTPAYDVRIKDVSEPLSLFYKARVFQNSDEEWNNVNLTLSTGNPSLGNNKPELLAYYLTFDNYYRPVTNASPVNAGPFNSHVTGRIISSEDGESLPGTTVMVKGTTTGTVTDIDGNFQLDLPQGQNTLVFSFIGFKAQEMVVNSPVVNVTMTPDMTQLDEVVVIGYGVSRDAEYDYSRNSSYTPRMRKIEQIPLAIEKSEVTTEFRIDIPYSIPSDNKPYDVTMVQYDINAGYEYTSVPKLSSDAFLIARIPEYIQYDLLGGNANIFFKGTFQGTSFIDPEISGDTLTLSVGRDKDIVVKREIQKDFTGRSLTGMTKKEQKAFLITVKNNKKVEVEIKLEDQYPVSKMDEIKVDLIESSGANADETTGKLTWDLKLAPGEKKEIALKYSVKYPSGRMVLVD